DLAPFNHTPGTSSRIGSVSSLQIPVATSILICGTARPSARATDIAAVMVGSGAPLEPSPPGAAEQSTKIVGSSRCPWIAMDTARPLNRSPIAVRLILCLQRLEDQYARCFPPIIPSSASGNEE